MLLLTDQQLRRELDAALLRAEEAERERDATRSRLEHAQAESADLQRLSEARFQRNNALECWNKEQEAELAATRSRLESVEAGLRTVEKYVIGEHFNNPGRFCRRCAAFAATDADLIRHNPDCPFAALGAAGERSETDG